MRIKLLRRFHHRFSIFEGVTVGLLILVTSLGAFSVDVSSIISFGHVVFLFTAFLVLRGVINYWNPTAGRIFFSVTVVLLTSELLIQTVSDFHLNIFILTLLLQPAASEHIGIPLWIAPPLLMVVFAAAFIASARLQKRTAPLNIPAIALVLFLSLGTSQVLHGYLFFSGRYDVVATRTELPFFFKPHRYYVYRVLAPLFGDLNWRPFIMPTPKTETKSIRTPKEEPVFSSRKNVLVIIADSLRSKDIRETPALIPNINRWAQKGWMNYNHYSVSNCTFNSMYAMFTGRLPTNYSGSRQIGTEHSLFDTFLANGYQISTSEASPLDWYGLADIIIPDGVKRTIVSDDEFTQQDHLVTETSIHSMAAAIETDKPFFHIAYYYGNHYPYAGTGNRATSYKDYILSIREVDQEIGTLLDTLDQKGITEETLIILTSDHGEQFTESGGFLGHSSRLSDEQTMVPFMVVGNGTNANTAVRSHLDFTPYLRAQFTGNRDTPLPSSGDPVILAGCGMAYPDSFAVISETSRVDFAYDDGYLAPIPHGSEETANEHTQFAAFNQLIAIIKKHEK